MSGNGWQAFRLVPDDVLFFRDGKPSTIGADHYLRSLFPPYPSTLYGAIRTRRLLDKEIELAGLGADTWSDRLDSLQEELGPWGGFGSLELRGPWLVRGDDEPLLPVPADLGILSKRSPRSKDERPEIKEIVRFRRAADLPRRWSHPLDPLLPFATDGKPWTAPGPGAEPRSAAGEWFLTPKGLSTWRAADLPAAADLVHRTELWVDEVRTGVGLQAQRRTSQEGLLYTFGYVRLLPGISIGFEVRGCELKPEGLIRLGGEGRTASLDKGPALPTLTASVSGAGGLSLCFATPALSESGGYPPGFSADRLEGMIGGQRCRLVAAAVPRSVLCGGWDLARRFPKTLRRAIPAGSVFLFEPLAGEMVFPADLDGRCLSDFSGEELPRQGFGMAVAGFSS